MSLLNFVLKPSKAVIVTDTLGYFGDGSAATLTSKFLPLPHLHAVILDRGSEYMAREAYMWAITQFFPGGLDDLIKAAPAALRDMQEAFVATHSVGIDSAHYQDRTEFFVFGWSERQGRIVGYAFTNQPVVVDGLITNQHEEDFEPVALRDDNHCMPPVDPSRLKLNAKPAHLFVQAAKLQQEAVLKDDGYGIGGELILFQLSRHDMSMRTIHRFADYHDTLAEIAGEENGELGRDQRVA